MKAKGQITEKVNGLVLDQNFKTDVFVSGEEGMPDPIFELGQSGEKLSGGFRRMFSVSTDPKLK